jgi:hypothetical protein
VIDDGDQDACWHADDRKQSMRGPIQAVRRFNGDRICRGLPR